MKLTWTIVKVVLIAVCTVLFASVFVAPGCGSGGTSSSPRTPSSPGAGGNTLSVQHVVMVVLENANYADVAGSASMPYLNSLTGDGSLVGSYFANTHPSIGDYFMLTTGNIQTNDDNFSGIISGSTIVDSFAAANISWKFYGESLPAVGYTGGDMFPYLRRHNPFSYFASVQNSASLAANMVPFTQFASDLNSNSLPGFAMVVPNAINDAHSCADGSTTSCTLTSRLAIADAWLGKNIAPLLANAQFQSNGLLIITFDEAGTDNSNGGGRVFTLLRGRHVRHNFTGSGTYQHENLLRTMLQMLKVNSFPGQASSATMMQEFFQ